MSAALYSLGHGGNDAQKTIGIIWMLLIAARLRRGGDDPPPCWVIVALLRARSAWARCSAAGASSRRWARSITKLKPVGGFCAETGGAITLFLATALGIPVSTTHTITGAIVGVGSVRKTVSGALGRGRQHRVGLDLHHPVLGLRRGHRVVACPPLHVTGRSMPPVAAS